MFGSFFGPLWGYPIDRIPLPMRPIITDNELTTRNVYKSTIWAQTLASLDVVVEGVDFPEMNINEWVLFKDVGDYSLSLVTRFCVFKPTKIVYYLNDETKKLFKIAQNRI